MVLTNDSKNVQSKHRSIPPIINLPKVLISQSRKNPNMDNGIIKIPDHLLKNNKIKKGMIKRKNKHLFKIIRNESSNTSIISSFFIVKI